VIAILALIASHDTPFEARPDARYRRRVRPRTPRARATRGFTAYEILVGLTGLAIVADLGMVALATYERRAKTAEATESLKTIAAAAAAAYDASADDAHPGDRRFPPSSVRSVPPDLPSVRGKRYQSNVNDWAWSPWKDLGFSIPQPQFYAYSFSSGGRGAQAHATAMAQGDLDGNGKGSMFTITITPDAKLHAVVPAEVQRQAADE
jgi:hypothetical protein